MPALNLCVDGDFVLACKRIFTCCFWPPEEVKSALYHPGAFKAYVISRRTVPGALVSAGWCKIRTECGHFLGMPAFVRVG